MQKRKDHKKKVMLKCDIPAENLERLQGIREATGITVTQLFTAMLDRIGPDFKVDDVPLGETRILRLYLDRELLSRLRRTARDHDAGTSAFIRAIIAQELERISKQHKT